jgi:hypothetical protein
VGRESVVSGEILHGVGTGACPIEERRSAMLRTYEGVLEGDRVRWTGEDAPATDRPLRVHITVLEVEAEEEERGQKMADALSRLAESGAFSGIEDPGAWQREIREDRPLPGRDR